MEERECLYKLIDLISRYSSVYRGPYLPSRVSQTIAEPGSKILRESLADHVGILPIVATFIYPYLKVNLDIGKVLTMLAIHDVGETIVGDVLTVKRQKTQNEIASEHQAALSQLNQFYHYIYNEFEENKSLEAKFAHSVDKISPNLYEIIIDKKLAQERHSHFGFNIVKAVEKDANKMEWNPFLISFYNLLIEKIKDSFEVKIV